MLCTCLYADNKNNKLPMISKMFHINVFNSLGYFGPRRYGEDEHYYLRFFCLYINNFDYNTEITYTNNKKIGLFGTYKYYQNLNEVLYIVNRSDNSLTNLYNTNNRIELSKKSIASFLMFCLSYFNIS